MSQREDVEMERGIAQILYSFGPGNVFDYGAYDVSMRVKGLDDRDWNVQPVEGLDLKRIRGDIESRIGRFRNGDQPPWEIIGESDIDAFRPVKVSAEVFPLTMVCENSDCRRVDIRQKPSHYWATDHDDQKPGHCTACGSPLQQLPFVVTHECGAVLQPGPINECPQHERNDPYLYQPTRDPAKWEFRCKQCDKSMGRIAAFCQDCNEYVTGATPPGGGGLYYPATLLNVDIPTVGKGKDELDMGETWARVLMAAYLDFNDVPLNEENTIEDIATRAGEQDRIEELRASGRTDEEIEMFLEMRAESGGEVDHLTSQFVAEKTRGNVTPVGVGGDAEVDAERVYSVLANQLFTFVRATQGYEGSADHDDYDPSRQPAPRSLSDLLTPEFKQKYPRAKEYREKLDRINVNEAWVVDNFPLLNVLFGYYRESPDPSEVDLNAFDHPYGDANKVPIFADRSPSEAIILEVDRRAIVEWLEENDRLGEASPRPDPDADDAEYKKWFLNNIDVVATDNPFTPVEHDTTQEVYTLLHSMSHALVSTASDQCGLATESISEMIMPAIPAIILYAKSAEHFALGGMATLFETRIHPWVDHTIDYTEQCLLDPPCSRDETGAACHACLHVNTVSCESMNEYLDRRRLVGGYDSTPFWDV
ncbi:hypothetical protein C464_16652 [Halorubrum coriense DSM 10284]|uniref:Uncharacterized protein n=1 Tax=Halorubrum coriense DSM 10284 TaxID=1227466 RepID=M0E6E7_9EURY|nr:DUF1998 domain-containing protein [Halorubrum coriense]ELZ43375.1 hypothetical protein C464_16652 [Halorubrum coriense DSM 10284]